MILTVRVEGLREIIRDSREIDSFNWCHRPFPKK